MRLQLTNPEEFGLFSAIIDEATKEMIIKSDGSHTSIKIITKTASAKSSFTKEFGKGAKWEEVKEEKVVPLSEQTKTDLFGDDLKEKEEFEFEKKGSVRPNLEDKNTPVAKKEEPQKKVAKSINPFEIEDSFPKKTADKAIEVEEDSTEVGSFNIEEPSVELFDVEQNPEGDFDLNSYKTEPSEMEKVADDIKKSREGKKEVVKMIAPVEIKDPTGMTEFKTQATALTNITKAIVVIESDIENESARTAAKNLNNLKKDIDARRKELNKPLDLNIKSNNAQAKKIVDPIDKELDRVKNLIGTYENKKEQERQAVLRAAEKKKEEQEKIQAAESARILRLKNSIDRMNHDLSDKVEKARKSSILLQYKKQLSNWKPSKDNFMEFIDEVLEVVENIKERIEIRLPIIMELEEAKETGNTLKISEISELLGEVKIEEKIKEEAKIDASETEDFHARQELITLFTQIGVDDVPNEVENIIHVYGNAQNAIMHRDSIIEHFKIKVATEDSINENKKSVIKNQRVDFEFEIIDKSKIPVEFLKVDDVAIRTAIKLNREKLLSEDDDFSISGIIIRKVTKTVLR